VGENRCNPEGNCNLMDVRKYTFSSKLHNDITPAQSPIHYSNSDNIERPLLQQYAPTLRISFLLTDYIYAYKKENFGNVKRK
jgi:hypothetical protein